MKQNISRFFLYFFIAMLTAIFSVCGAPPQGGSSSSQRPSPQGRATQVGKIIPIRVGQGRNRSMRVELANSYATRKEGYKNRRELAYRTDGMLFVFPAPQFATFWMKDTTIPLDLAFFNEAQILV